MRWFLGSVSRVSQRWLAPVSVVLLASAAVSLLGACERTSEVEDTGSPTAAPQSSASATPAPTTPAAAATASPGAVSSPTAVSELKGDAVERANQATEADRAKPRFTGELGDFVIVEPNTAAGYPCPEPYQPATNPERSELYFSLPGAVIDMEASGSCEGTIFAITASIAGGVRVGRGYFPGPKLEESFDAPAERLKVITVAGKPALAELPIPDCLVCTSEVAVIERFPSEGAPGITVWASTTNDLDRAIALAEQIMGAP